MKKITRRSMIACACAVASTRWIPLQARPIHGGAAAPGGDGGGGELPNLTVELTFPGGSPTASKLVYDIAAGTDIGSYTAPTAGFTQRCIRVRHASLDKFMVDFRPDTNGGRVEIVFWNGEINGTVPTRTFRNLPAYDVVVKLNGVAQSDWRGVSKWSIPHHYWGNRWRWESAKRSVIRTPSQVFSGNYLPKMSLTAARVTGYRGVIVPQAPSIPSPSNNNGRNGDGTAMTQGTNGYLYLPFMIPDDRSVRLWGISCTGDDGGARPELGLITEWQAHWLLTRDSGSLNTMMQQAELFSCQANAIFLPDQSHHGPVNQKGDLARYKISTYNYGSYYLAVTGGTATLASGGFVGGISGTTLTITSAPSSPIRNGYVLKGASSTGTSYDGILPGTYVVSQLASTEPGGALGGRGTYQVSKPQAVTPASGIFAAATTGEYKSKGDEHSPQIWYLPWVITEDPFYIEAQQYHETYALMQDIYYKENIIGNLASDPTGARGINGRLTLPPSLPGTAEERAIGWCVKNIANCYKMTPANAPSWLLPQSYWASVSSDVSKFIDYCRATWPTDQFYTVFNSIVLPSSGDTPQTFYKAYAAYDFGFADLVGLPTGASTSWLNHLVYMFDFIRKTTDSTLASGFNVQSPIIHDLGAGLITNRSPKSGCTIGTSTVAPSGSNCIGTYAQLETYSGPYNRDSSPYPNNPSPGYIGRNPGNLGPLYAGAAVAKSRGVAGAAAVMTFIGSMIDYSFPQPGYGFAFKYQDGFDGT